MRFIHFCVFFLFVYVLNIYNTQGYDFNGCPTSENDFLNVTFGSLNVECNTNYAKQLVSLPPNISFPHAVQEKFYEVVMIDPDAPSASNPECRSWLHLLLSNVKGSDLKKGISVNDVTRWNTVAEYNPPTPPEGTGYHRYIQAVFSHAKELKLKMRISQRCGFDIDFFALTHNLGETPDASNMFKTTTKLDRVEKATNEL